MLIFQARAEADVEIAEICLRGGEPAVTIDWSHNVQCPTLPAHSQHHLAPHPLHLSQSGDQSESISTHSGLAGLSIHVRGEV